MTAAFTRETLTTPAELQAMRELLGLTQRWLADRLFVRERTVRRWEDGESPVTAKASAKILELWNEANRAVDEAVATTLELRAGDLVTITTLRTDAEVPGDKPATWHRAIAARAMDRLLTHTTHTVRMEFE